VLLGPNSNPYVDPTKKKLFVTVFLCNWKARKETYTEKLKRQIKMRRLINVNAIINNFASQKARKKHMWFHGR